MTYWRNKKACCSRLAAWSAGAVLLCALASRPMVAQTVALPAQLATASNTTRANIERFQQFVAAKQWEEALDTLMSMMESPTDEMILNVGERNGLAQYLPVREHCHRLLVQTHATAPEVLERYRQRVDPLARLWLEKGREAREDAALERIVDRMFASSVADDALLLLGDRALERGEFQKARAHWEAITPIAWTPPNPPSGAIASLPLYYGLLGIDWENPQAELSDWLGSPREVERRRIFPDSQIAPADVLARLVLASLFEGARERAKTEYRVLQMLYPDATGRLAGREGKWTDLVADLMRGSQEWESGVRPADWRQFAGRLDRNGAAEAEPDPLVRPLWTKKFPAVSANTDLFAEKRPRTAEAEAGLLSIHPIVVGDRVFVPQPYSVLAFHLRTGGPKFSTSPDPDQSIASAAIFQRRLLGSFRFDSGVYGAPRYTLSSYGNWVFARVGLPFTSWPSEENGVLPRDHWSWIVGLDLEAEGKLLPGFPLEPDDGQWAFDGTPICDGPRLYTAMKRRDSARVGLHVACFETATGRRLWRREIASRDPYGEGFAPEITHTLLALSDGDLFVNTNQGAVAAINSVSGDVQWIATYPRSAPRPADVDVSDRHFFRDLNPCLLDRGRVIVAPADSDQVLAFEQSTGRALWATRPGATVNANSILGVRQGVLLLGGDSLFWIQANSGRLLCQAPPPTHRGDGFALPEPRGIGRGALAGDQVYFPTRDAIYVYTQKPVRGALGWEPRAARAPINLLSRGVEGGNLVIAEDILLIVGANSVTAFGTTPPPPGRDQEAGVQ